ncbi:GNAT family N-acetyltransferase [Kitasatospora sp. CM 4170]|uniref:GNAT family N-acetyltransferase n=1 Tax=Kitasatospora aburaviensis TaxID=67265 RepID=A0ABW1EUR4_9ACTN|nr:GNAT family N-acetyltransferase [Kitasatospora sp. CM 4170]WNM49999.1 GNAT family N-acetyltransferase [Kitasatospora sp. CM 4170]
MRPFRDEDAPALIGIHRDETLRRFTRTPVNDPAEAARWLELQRRGWAEGHRYSFAVLEPRDGGGGGRTDGRDDVPAELVANVVLKRADPGGPAAEVGYWTAAPARGRGVAPRALEVLTGWAFAAFAADGLVRLDLLHQVDNAASCRVAEKAGYGFRSVLPALPPEFPLDGHLHSRSALCSST